MYGKEVGRRGNEIKERGGNQYKRFNFKRNLRGFS
jgi:hypothetical protein